MKSRQGRALITGAAGGLGLAAATAFGKAGARLLVTDRRAAELDETVRQLVAAGFDVAAHPCDQTSSEAVADFFAVAEAVGGLHSAFINAGYGRYGALIDIPADQWRRHIDVNLTGGFMMAQGAARLMRRAGSGAIVFNASTAANFPCDLLGAYASAKAGIAMLSRSMASEFGTYGIRVNTVLPGVIETSMTKSLLDDPATRADVLSETPVGRLGRPDDIADAVVFLCSDASGYITGSELLIDGGQTIHAYPRWFKSNHPGHSPEWIPQSSHRDGGKV